MGADLKGANWLSKESAIVAADGLVILEHGGAKDRTRKILFDRVESVLVWKTLPWLRMLLFAVILGVPGTLLLLLVRDKVPSTIGAVVLGICVVIEAWYLYARKATIRVHRGGQNRDFVAITWPGRLRRVLGRMRQNIEAVQGQAAQRAEQREAERREAEAARLAEAAEPPPVEEPTDGPPPAETPPE